MPSDMATGTAEEIGRTAPAVRGDDARGASGCRWWCRSASTCTSRPGWATATSTARAPASFPRPYAAVRAPAQSRPSCRSTAPAFIEPAAPPIPTWPARCAGCSRSGRARHTATVSWVLRHPGPGMPRETDAMTQNVQAAGAALAAW